jgi:hypothetical protein
MLIWLSKTPIVALDNRLHEEHNELKKVWIPLSLVNKMMRKFGVSANLLGIET